MMKYIIYTFFILFIATASYIDFKTHKIPNKLNLLGFIVGLSIIKFNSLITWRSALMGMALGFTLLLIATILTNGGYGAGDIKFIAVIGLFMGLKYTCYIIFISAWLQIVYKLLSKKKVAAFGPTLSLSSLICLIILFNNYR